MANTDPRQATLDAMDALGDPIPYLDEMMNTSHRQGGFFIFGGGCLTWLVLGVFVGMFVLVKYGAIAVYACAVTAVRLLVILGCLVWWGWDSEAGVIRRWRG